MDFVPVFYATSEGHTRQIAYTIAATLRSEGFESEPVELVAGDPSPNWTAISTAVVGASVHIGKHQKTAAEFVRREAKHLAARQSSFFSVSLAAASRNSAGVDAARAIATKFVRDAGWQPRHLACFAGKLAYTKYGFFTRWMMRRISSREGGPTDTSRDHEMTDWAAVRTFARQIANDLRAERPQRVAS
jgi:menaquinone-dependent protoporphyrinogen oxidase